MPEPTLVNVARWPAFPPEVVLRRVSVYFRTVRYETEHAPGYITYSPVFPATALEWERASD